MWNSCLYLVTVARCGHMRIVVYRRSKWCTIFFDSQHQSTHMYLTWLFVADTIAKLKFYCSAILVISIVVGSGFFVFYESCKCWPLASGTHIHTLFMPFVVLISIVRHSCLKRYCSLLKSISTRTVVVLSHSKLTVKKVLTLLPLSTCHPDLYWSWWQKHWSTTIFQANFELDFD